MKQFPLLYFQLHCCTYTGIMLYRLICSAYLIFGMSLSIANHSAKAPWMIFLTSWIYVLSLIYFLYGSALSWYSVRYKVEYCRSNTMSGDTVKHFPKRVLESAKSSIRDNMNMHCMSNKNATISSTSSSNIGGSTSQLITSPSSKSSSNLCHGFSVDSIIYDIEQNSKRLSVNCKSDIDNPSVPSTNPQDLHHARLRDNRLPSMNSEVFLSETIGEVPWPFKVYWLLSSSVITLSICAIFAYWIFLFDGQSCSLLAWYLRIDRHGIASLLVILERMTTRTPIRLLHFVYPSIFSLLYGVSNAVYCYLEKTYVYSKLDFVGSTTKACSLVLLGALVAVPVIHMISYFGVYRFKEWFSEKVNR